MKDVPTATGQREQEVVLINGDSRPDGLIKTADVSVQIPR